MYKTFAVIIGLAFVMLVGTCVYFVAGVSSTYPPLKEYGYSESFFQLKTRLDKLSLENNRMKYEITDTLGAENVGYKYRITINLKRGFKDLEYQIFYGETDYWFKKNTTQIGLVFAYNRTDNTGGYGYEGNAEITKSLVRIFEAEILENL